MSVKPITVTTANVKEALLHYAKSSKVSVDSLSFDILGFATYYRQHPSTKWVSITDKNRRQVLQEKYLCSPLFYFKEQYKIKIYSKLATIKGCAPDLKLKANASKSKLLLIVQKTSVFTVSNECLQEYIHETRRKLLLSNYFIGLFVMDLSIIFKPLIAEFKKKKTLMQDVKLPLAKARDPETNRSMTLVEHYLNKDEDKRSAYEKGVDAKELIFEYIYPLLATHGRSCQGLILKPFGPDIDSCELISYDDTVSCLIEETSMKYYAEKSGYVDFHENHIMVSNSLNLEGAAFNTTGSITLGGHREIDLTITSNDEMDDAIDKGVDIDVSNLEVRGSVGGNTSLKAETISIGAQTHSTTKIVAQEASVNLHRGDLSAKNAEISKLEHGLVQAETVKVKEMLGGEIRAKRVDVMVLHSKVKIYASEVINIAQIKGLNNKLIIAPDKVENQDDAIANLEKEIIRLKSELASDEKSMDEKFKNYELNYARIDDFKRQVAKAAQEGKPPSKAAAIRVKQYSIDTIRLDELNNNLSEKRSLIEEAILDLDKHKNIMLYAKINFKGIWDGHQEIFYEHSHSDTIEKYIPEGKIDTIIYTQIPEDELITVSRED